MSPPLFRPYFRALTLCHHPPGIAPGATLHCVAQAVPTQHDLAECPVDTYEIEMATQAPAPLAAGGAGSNSGAGWGSDGAVGGGVRRNPLTEALVRAGMAKGTGWLVCCERVCRIRGRRTRLGHAVARPA